MQHKQLCTGELTGVLNSRGDSLRRSYNGTVFSVKLSKRFGTWLKYNTEIKGEERTFIVLPKTLKDSPYLIFEVLGVVSDDKVEPNDSVIVVGIVESYDDCFTYLRVHKSSKKGEELRQTSFLFRLKGSLLAHNAQATVGTLCRVYAELDLDNEYVIKHTTLYLED